MKIILSPAKTLNFNCEESSYEKSLLFETEALQLFNKLSKLSKKSIQQSMKISDKLTQETYDLYHNFNTSQPKYNAIELYNGLAYRQLHISAYNQDQLDYLESHLSILSAMYGVLSPLTPIWPYRLDFVMSFKQLNLKKFWANKLSNYFKNEDWILNIASEEFSQFIQHPYLHTLYFYDEKKGKRTINSAEAKKARGQTLEWAILNKLETIDDLRHLCLKDYILESHDQTQSIFVRYIND